MRPRSLEQTMPVNVPSGLETGLDETRVPAKEGLRIFLITIGITAYIAGHIAGGNIGPFSEDERWAASS